MPMARDAIPLMVRDGWRVVRLGEVATVPGTAIQGRPRNGPSFRLATSPFRVATRTTWRADVIESRPRYLTALRTDRYKRHRAASGDVDLAPSCGLHGRVSPGVHRA